MNVVSAGLAILLVTAAAVGLMLFVRSRAPEGSYFADSDRAAGIFGVLATGFSVLLGFLIFLGFESYDASRSGAEAEALAVAEQIQTAQALPADVGAELTGELVCYVRSVIYVEWERMEDGSLGEDINPWGAEMFTTLRGVELTTPVEEASFGKWLDETSARQEARQARVHGASGVMPTPLWIALFFITLIVLVYMLGFADSSERAWVSGLFMGSVVAVIVTMLLLLRFLDEPYRGDVGGLQPTAMKRIEVLVSEQLEVLVTDDLVLPCDDQGVPL